jgi:hypothetical protein
MLESQCIVAWCAALSGVRGQIPLIIPQKGPLTGQLLHQFKPGHMTSQPAIISVTQGQQLTPMVAKVSLTTGPHTAVIQTLSTVTGSPITVTQVTLVFLSLISLASVFSFQFNTRVDNDDNNKTRTSIS